MSFRILTVVQRGDEWSGWGSQECLRREPWPLGPPAATAATRGRRERQAQVHRSVCNTTINPKQSIINLDNNYITCILSILKSPDWMWKARGKIYKKSWLIQITHFMIKVAYNRTIVLLNKQFHLIHVRYLHSFVQQNLIATHVIVTCAQQPLKRMHLEWITVRQLITQIWRRFGITQKFSFFYSQKMKRDFHFHSLTGSMTWSAVFTNLITRESTRFFIRSIERFIERLLTVAFPRWPTLWILF